MQTPKNLDSCCPNPEKKNDRHNAEIVEQQLQNNHKIHTFGIMFFDDWKEKSVGLKVSERLLWDCDMSRVDWQAMRIFVMQRVIERGWPNDYYAAIRLYGGVENVREIIKQIPILSDKDMNFVISIFNLKKEELKCSTFRQLRARHLDSLSA